ncbi:NAD-dependent epimerase/dehydratase family protein [Paenibacillus sp. 481]|uniref:NAD-dependent epimerase/dehydratase family protein n=1 Tax=Paenibacillus sp. 481 TaxID=2835869 RepID=UPI001E386752|nr:NAD-dependent epimerase/dehydratase family protein [Paenibacillus sp. 481]UHA74481.1 GDP-mannose 4,6-dehydratase [Paenibacillus sp. 481]
MRIIVTGGAGFIGSHLVEALLERGDDVHVIDDGTTGYFGWLPSQAVLHPLSVTDEAACLLVERLKPDSVIHLAAQADVKRSLDNPIADMQANVLGTLMMLEACHRAKVGQFVLASTSAVYGQLEPDMLQEDMPTEPISCYGLSKLTAERYVEQYIRHKGVKGAVLRFANVYGPRQTPKGEGGVVAVYLKLIQAGQPLRIDGDGEQTRDFIYVADVADACMRVVDAGLSGLWQVGTGKSTSINELISMLEHVHGRGLHTVHAPARQGDIRHSCLAFERVARDVGWAPRTSLLDGLRQTYHDMNM